MSHSKRSPCTIQSLQPTRHRRFVEVLCALRDARPRAETLREAQIEWKSIKGDRELVDSRIRAYEEAVVARQRVTCQIFKRTGDTFAVCAPSSSSSASETTSRSPSSSTSPMVSTPQEPALTVATGMPLEASRAVNSFLGAIGIEPGKLLTQDVQAQSLFMTTLRDMLECWLRFSAARDERCDSGQRREWRKSMLKQSISQTDETLRAISEHLQGIADIQVSPTNLLSAACFQAAQKKGEMVRNTMYFLPQLQRATKLTAFGAWKFAMLSASA